MPLLFSYGTLQQREVQQATYGRLLMGTRDSLTGYRLEPLAIEDADVVRLSGKAVHMIARHTGDPSDRIAGTCFHITDQELAMTDTYEVADYLRAEVQLESGQRGFVYVGQPVHE
jgi:gamma-glutamylcyclotransferase (GGCT)/AIG2-like uncharacterized protein YtfP